MQFKVRPSKNLLPITDVTISIINLGIQGKEPEHKYGPIMRSEYILQYITDGEGYYEIGGKTYELKKGDMFCISKNVLHKYWANKNNPYTYYWLGIDGQNVKRLLELIGFSVKNPVLHYLDDKIIDKFSKIKGALEKNNFASFIKSLSAVYDLLSYLLKKNNQNKKPIESDSIKYVNQVIEYIHGNYNEDITVTRLADKIGLCRNYLSVIFKKAMGISPVEYLLSYRISKAQIMLKEGESVTETAINSGFNSINNFSAQFKRIVGISPYAFKTGKGNGEE